MKAFRFLISYIFTDHSKQHQMIHVQPFGISMELVVIASGHFPWQVSTTSFNESFNMTVINYVSYSMWAYCIDIQYVAW